MASHIAASMPARQVRNFGKKRKKKMSATTRLKMHVTSVKSNRLQDGGYDSDEIRLTAVYGDANKSWSKWTPSGQLTFTVTNSEVIGKILPYGYYVVELTETTKED